MANFANPGLASFVLEHSPSGDFTLNTSDLTADLTAGTYVLAISAWNNYGCPFRLTGCTLADGFSGLANLPFGHDTFFDIRISGDVSTGQITPVPEPPAVLLLVASGILGLAGIRRRTGCE